jgi:ribonuclease HI
MSSSYLIEIYTDGSCHTQHCIGGWAAIIFINSKKIVLSGLEEDTTHNRMEILAVINALEYVKSTLGIGETITVVSDSQYVIGLIERQTKFLKSDFKTKAGLDIRNVDLVKHILELLNQLQVSFVKIKAHQKTTNVINYNNEVDKLCRHLVREAVTKNLTL